MILVCYLLHGKPTIRAVTPGPSFPEAETLLVLGASVHIFGRNYSATSSGLILTVGLETMAFELPCLQSWLVVCQAPAALGFLVEEQKGRDREFTELVVLPSPRPPVHCRGEQRGLPGSGFRLCFQVLLIGCWNTLSMLCL